MFPGRILAEMLMRNELILTNTIFPHKMAHRTTLESPMKNTGNRKNPYRNQIGYVIMRKSHRIFINDSRSHNGLQTFTDHRLVRTKLDIKWYKMKKEKTQSKLNIDLLKEKENKTQYNLKVSEKLSKRKSDRCTRKMEHHAKSMHRNRRRGSRQEKQHNEK